MLRAEEPESAGIHKEVELLHPDSEDAGEEEVSEFVYDYQCREGYEHLQHLDEYHHLPFLFSINADAYSFAASLVANMSSRLGDATNSTPSIVSATSSLIP